MEDRNPGNTKFSGQSPRRGNLLASAQIPAGNGAAVSVVDLPMQRLFRFTTDRDYRRQCLAYSPHWSIIVVIADMLQLAQAATTSPQELPAAGLALQCGGFSAVRSTTITGVTARSLRSIESTGTLGLANYRKQYCAMNQATRNGIAVTRQVPECDE